MDLHINAYHLNNWLLSLYAFKYHYYYYYYYYYVKYLSLITWIEDALLNYYCHCSRSHYNEICQLLCTFVTGVELIFWCLLRPNPKCKQILVIQLIAVFFQLSMRPCLTLTLMRPWAMKTGVVNKRTQSQSRQTDNTHRVSVLENGGWDLVWTIFSSVPVVSKLIKEH